MSGSLWGTDLTAKPEERSPYSILREQAMRLREQTEHIVWGEVCTTAEEDRVAHELTLFAPAIQRRVTVVRVTTGATPYPATITSRFLSSVQTVKNETAFQKELKRLLGGKPVSEAVRTLVADSRATGFEFFLVEDGELIGESVSLEAAKERARRMVGPGGWIDIHQVKKGVVGRWVWLDDENEPKYSEEHEASAAG